MIGPLIDGAIKRRKVVLGVTLIASLFGLIAYLKMPREAQPDIQVPFVGVYVPYPGVSPEDSERLLIRPLEIELQRIEGLKEMNATARQGSASVALEFEPNFDKAKVLQDVRAKVDVARGEFPPDAEEPVVWEASFSDEPVVGIVLYGSAPERELQRVTHSLRQRLAGAPGVLEANIGGGREELLEVVIDPVRMETYNVTTSELAQVISRNNQLVPAGDLRSGAGKFAVKVPGVVEDPQDILALPVKRNGDRLVRVSDIGEVRRTFKEAAFISRFNGQPAYSVEVSKRAGANILETVENVRRIVAEEQSRWPATISVAYTYDTSDQIKYKMVVLESGLLIATLLVMLIIVASLGIRQGLMVGAAIPACFMIAFLLLDAFGETLNQMVMFGLVLAVGILVDGGIVVIEYADRKMAEGLPKQEAFAAAGKRMFWPVVNGTLTTLCAFLPFLFWNSIPGKFMSYLPITLFFVLGASIFVALLFTPALGSIFGRATAVDANHLAEIEKSERGDPRQMSGFMGWYARTLSDYAQRPLMVMAGSLVMIMLVATWFKTTPHPTEFFLREDPAALAVYVKGRGNMSPEAQDDLVRQVEARLQNIRGVESIYVRSGPLTSGGGRNAPPNDSIGRIQLAFVDYEHMKALDLRGADIEKTVRARVSDLPGLQIEVRSPQTGPPVGKDLQIELRSNDPGALDRAADLVRAKLASDPQLIDVEDNRTSPGIEWNLAVDREAAGRYGVDVLSVGQAIQFVTNGVLVGRFRPDDSEEELDIRMRFPQADRNIGAFDDLKISTPQGPVPASYFIKRAPAQQVSSIQRRDGQKLVVLQANVEGVAGNLKIASLKSWLPKAGIGDDVRWTFIGADKEGKAATAFFVTAIAVALFLMSLILLWQFNSFYGVVVTLSAVAMSIMGVLLGVQLNLFHTFDYISVVLLGTGVVALAGVVVGHNIVLVDTFYQLKRSGFSADEAAVRAAAQRFRPVMLTTVVTVVGLLPLMFRIHPNFRTGHVELNAPGSEWWVQLSAAVVWGLSFSTLLTLMLTPVLLAAPKVLSERLRGRGKGPTVALVTDSDLPHAAE